MVNVDNNYQKGKNFSAYFWKFTTATILRAYCNKGLTTNNKAIKFTTGEFIIKVWKLSLRQKDLETTAGVGHFLHS